KSSASRAASCFNELEAFSCNPIWIWSLNYFFIVAPSRDYHASSNLESVHNSGSAFHFPGCRIQHRLPGALEEYKPFQSCNSRVQQLACKQWLISDGRHQDQHFIIFRTLALVYRHGEYGFNSTEVARQHGAKAFLTVFKPCFRNA